MNSELNKSRLKQELKPKKYQIKKRIIAVAKVISIVQPIYKYILKPVAKYLYKKITSKSEVKKLSERIDQLVDQIEKIKIDKEQMMTTLNLINKQQKAEMKDLSLIVEQEIASIDDKIQKKMPLPKLIFLS